jgi:pimeloyl-ACP methyl ester carboxylesterase
LNRPVYALDLRNHGDSPHSPQHDYLSLADDVAGFMAEHGLQNTTLIGHSMGAKTAMALALRDPDLVDTLIAVDNAPVDAALKSEFGTYVQGMRKVEAAGVKRQSEADEILKEFAPVCIVTSISLSTAPYTIYI